MNAKGVAAKTSAKQSVVRTPAGGTQVRRLEGGYVKTPISSAGLPDIVFREYVSTSTR